MIRLLIISALVAVVYSSPQRGGTIIGGYNAKNGQFPYQVAILVWRQIYCGGSILSSTRVLTAAHCSVDNVNNFQVLAGTVNYRRPQDGQLRSMASFRPHPQYRRASSGFDVAIVRIRGSFTFNSLVQPVALNTNSADPTGNTIATGWGLVKLLNHLIINSISQF